MDEYTLARPTEVSVGMHVRMKLGRGAATARLGGIVREVHEEHVLVEPDYPEVGVDGMFDMWRCRKDQLLVRRRRGA